MRQLLLTLIGSTCIFAQDALEIVRRSVHHDQANYERAKNYTYVVHSTMRERNTDGSIKKVESRAEEVLILYGEPYEKRISKDGKPLPPDEQRKEQEKFDREMGKRRNESEDQRRRRVDAFEKKRREQREITREIPDAFHFKLVGEETIAGRKAWIIDAWPREDYQPKNSKAAMLKKFKGRMWIDQQEYQWVRLEGEAIDTVTWGLFLARLSKGSRIFFEQVRVNDEVWMPKQVKVDLDARIALLKRYLGDINLRYQDFRKFQSDSRIVSTAELMKNP